MFRKSICVLLVLFCITTDVRSDPIVQGKSKPKVQPSPQAGGTVVPSCKHEQGPVFGIVKPPTPVTPPNNTPVTNCPSGKCSKKMHVVNYGGGSGLKFVSDLCKMRK